MRLEQEGVSTKEAEKDVWIVSHFMMTHSEALITAAALSSALDPRCQKKEYKNNHPLHTA